MPDDWRHGHPPDLAAPDAGDAAQDDQAVADADRQGELDDLLQVIAIGDARPERKYAQRSWELMEKARLCKASRSADFKIEKAEKKRKQCEEAFAVIQSSFPAVASIVGLEARGKRRKDKWVLLSAKLAFLPHLRHMSSFRRTQGISLSAVADVV